MKDNNKLLRLILTDPSNNQLRLQYARWHSQQKDPTNQQLGKMIQFQLESSTEAEEFSSQAIEARILISKYASLWTKELPTAITNFTYFRGLIEHIEVDTHYWIRNKTSLLCKYPIRHLNLLRVHDNLQELLESKSLAGIYSLSLDNCQLVDENIELLSLSDSVSDIRWLSLRHNLLTMRSALAISNSIFLKQLRWADLYENPFSPRVCFSHDQGSVVETWLNEDAKRLVSIAGDVSWFQFYPSDHVNTSPNRFFI